MQDKLNARLLGVNRREMVVVNLAHLPMPNDEYLYLAGQSKFDDLIFCGSHCCRRTLVVVKWILLQVICLFSTSEASCEKGELQTR